MLSGRGCGGQRLLSEIIPVHLIGLGLNSGCQTWLHAPLPAEPSAAPKMFTLLIRVSFRFVVLCDQMFILIKT